MFVAVAKVELHLPMADSLKGKRKVLHSLRDRLHKRLRVSISETNHQNLWQRAELCVASVHRDMESAQHSLQRIREMFDQSFDVSVVGWSTDIWND